MTKRQLLALYLPLVFMAIPSVACQKPPTAAQAGAVAEAGCTLLAAFAGGPEEQAICATADDLIGLAADVRSARADASPEQKAGRLGRKSNPCRIIPSSTVCATEDELALAIRGRRGSR